MHGLSLIKNKLYFWIDGKNVKEHPNLMLELFDNLLVVEYCDELWNITQKGHLWYLNRETDDPLEFIQDNISCSELEEITFT